MVSTCFRGNKSDLIQMRKYLRYVMQGSFRKMQNIYILDREDVHIGHVVYVPRFDWVEKDFGQREVVGYCNSNITWEITWQVARLTSLVCPLL